MLYYVEIAYKNDDGLQTKAGFIEAPSKEDACQLVTDKVKAYHNTTEVWKAEACPTDSNGYDSYQYNQPQDFWDDSDQTSFDDDDD